MKEKNIPEKFSRVQTAKILGISRRRVLNIENKIKAKLKDLYEQEIKRR